MVLTDDVLDRVIGTIQDDIDAEFSHGAIGTGTSSPNEGDTALDAEVFRTSRQEISDATSSTTVSMLVGTTQANGNTINEVGWFNASSGGTLQSREVLDQGVDKTQEKELWVDLTVEIDVTQS